MQSHNLLAVFGFITAALALTACGTVSRESYDPARPSQTALLPPDGIRILANDSINVSALGEEVSARLSAGGSARHTILALSGGGANGAYGAGVIAGWTETGTRPEFDVVTGISTGALAAPFAFLGPRWDDSLKRAYTDGRTQNLLSWQNFAAFFAPSLFNPRSLRKLVDRYITSELLSEIAIEHGKGRRLLVVTTNLDAQQAEIWDMGALAVRGDRSALLLFRRILIASSSIPGVFPPVMIPGRASDGRAVDEMHADGGVSMPFLVVPESLSLWTIPDAQPGAGAVYVLVNGQLDPEYGVTPGNLPAILTRSFDIMSKASLRATLLGTAVFAQRNGMSLEIAAIPPGAGASSIDLNKHSMRALFELGRLRGASGEAWSTNANDPKLSDR